MSAAEMTKRTAEASPRTKARLAGVFFLLYTLTGTYGYFVSGQIVVSGDAAATAANILANQTLFYVAIAANLVSQACYLVVIVLLYASSSPSTGPSPGSLHSSTSRAARSAHSTPSSSSPRWTC